MCTITCLILKEIELQPSRIAVYHNVLFLIMSARSLDCLQDMEQIELEGFPRQLVFARTVRRCLQQYERLARQPCFWPLLTLFPALECVQCFVQRRTWMKECHVAVFTASRWVASMFGGIVDNARNQHAFHIVILAHHLE